jgi:hypothetical protein
LVVENVPAGLLLLNAKIDDEGTGAARFPQDQNEWVAARTEKFA